jgi:RNA-directed DNA polymerase
MNMPKPEEKPFAIPKLLVWEAWRQVKANKGAPGVDGQALDEFEADLTDNLYRIWNRMSSGSYFPSPVRVVEIPKPRSPGTRVLGVPNAVDRVVCEAVRQVLEPVYEPTFDPSSHGFRVGRSCHMLRPRPRAFSRKPAAPLVTHAPAHSLPFLRPRGQALACGRSD